MKRETVYAGKLFRVLHIHQADGRIFEVAERAPGVRLIIVDKNKSCVLLTRESRHELGGAIDWRLPGGKVFDSLKEFVEHEDTAATMLDAATQKAVQEAREETGLVISSPCHLHTSKLGATVSWDLWFFEVTEWKEHADGQRLVNGADTEDITVEWVDFDRAKQLALHEMQEERSALVLLRWLENSRAH